MNLSQFLESRAVRNRCIEYPGFRELYIRKGAIAFTINDNQFKVNRAVTLARLNVERRGKGTFRKLVDELIVHYDVAIIVECVMTPRFANHLTTVGFDLIRSHGSAPSFVINWKEKITIEKASRIPVIRRLDADLPGIS